MSPLVATAALSLALSAQVFAQDISTWGEHARHSPSATIDGSTNPELIPDGTAYRLFLLTVAPVPDQSSSDEKRQRAHLRRIGLSERDNSAFLVIAGLFQARYADFIRRYNEAAEAAAAKGTAPEYETLLLERDSLVQDMRQRLQLALSPEGFQRLHAHVQQEKRAMKITVPQH